MFIITDDDLHVAMVSFQGDRHVSNEDQVGQKDEWMDSK